VFSHGQLYVALSAICGIVKRCISWEYMGSCKEKHEHRSYWKEYEEYCIQRCLGIVRWVCATALYNRRMKKYAKLKKVSSILSSYSCWSQLYVLKNAQVVWIVPKIVAILF
jgi:hypothetical protein